GQPATAQTLGGHPSLPPALDSVRAALERYQDPIAAIHDGYLSTVACTQFPREGKAGGTPYPAGGMGVHLLNPALIGAPLDPARPQVLIYEPRGDTLRLAAAEWFVPTAASPERPQLFGRPFDGPMAGHHPIMPEALRHWDLHVWLWRENPAGVFTPTNPALRCPPGVYTLQLADGH
ncbi:MAG TPA: hypothetical protein VNI61_07570, partial [Gemmatimonadales bacterium]|nr:hypothetical protein [Gemmatimonadales bacterium]